MKVKYDKLVKLLEGRNHFQIPIYQRTYDWHKSQCKQLFDDIVKVGKNTTPNHFLGTITYLCESTPATEVSTYQLIDGQQRLTTLVLLLKALQSSCHDEKLKGKIEYLMFNQHEESKKRFKLKLTQDDDDVFRGILEGNETKSRNIHTNYKILKDLLAGCDYDQIWNGINKLTVVSIVIDKDNDAQAIFESMNSTGLGLSQTDMIQNYLLMPHDENKQQEIYNSYWKPMECKFESADFDEFLRNYLTMHKSQIIPKNNTYKYFKEHMSNRDSETEIKNIFKYSDYYANIIGICPHKSSKISRTLEFIFEQGTNVATSFLLRVLADYGNGLNEEQAEQVLLLVDSYLLRSYVCDTTKGGNKVFPEMISKIDKGNYVKSIEKTLMSKIGNRKFPRDVVFEDKLKQISLYNNRTMCKYILDRLEQYEHKEHVDPGDLQIEHIMPKTLDDLWKKNLGDDWEEIHERYIDNIGNLTLTGYNPELGNKSFSDKCENYKKSNVKITRDLANYEEWTKRTILERADKLTQRAINIWKCPKIDVESEPEFDVLEEDHLEGKEIGDLWKKLKHDVLSECSGTKFYMGRVYGGFKILGKTNRMKTLCTMAARNHHIHLGYSVKKGDLIMAESKFVDDVSDIGTSTSGNYRSTIRTEEDVQNVVGLLKKIVLRNA